jgi:hypothetical protein
MIGPFDHGSGRNHRNGIRFFFFTRDDAWPRAIDRHNKENWCFGRDLMIGPFDHGNGRKPLKRHSFLFLHSRRHVARAIDRQNKEEIALSVVSRRFRGYWLQESAR